MKALIPALALLALPALALAQPPGGGAGGPPRGPQTPEQIEANFKQMDTNKDGVVTKDEWTAAGRKRRGRRRARTRRRRGRSPSRRPVGPSSRIEPLGS